MSTPIATVLSVTGQAWARDADGNLRVLEPGDILLEGETLITSDNGRVRLDFGDAEPVAIGPGQTIAMLAELNADNPIPDDEASTTDENVEALLAAIEAGEGDLLDVLDPTAAGLGGGGGGGGSTFVRLARISESVDPLAFDNQPPQLDTLIDAQGGSFNGENDAPVANDDTGLGQEDSSLSGNVLTNDNDGDALAVTDFTVNNVIYQAGETAQLDGIGSLTVNGDGSYTFTPVANWNGQVPAVSYTVSDGELTDTATLELTIAPVNDAPVANDDTGTGVEDSIITGDVLNNDTDIDGDVLTVIDFTLNYPISQIGPRGDFGEFGQLEGVEPIFPDEQIANSAYQAGETATLYGIGTLTIESDGSYTFTPDANWNGEVPTVTYTITDGEFFDTATLELNVTPVNDPAVISGDTSQTAAETDEALTLGGTLTSADVDNADTFTPQTDVQGEHGTFSIDENGAWTFIANSAFDELNVGDSVSESFTATSVDGTEQDVTVTITGINDAAVISGDTSQTAAETDEALTLGGTLTSADVDNADTFTPQTDVQGEHGTFSIDENGAWTFIANSAFDELNVGDSVSESFTATSVDGTEQDVTVTITGTNDAAVISGDTSQTAAETDEALTLGGTLTSADVDNADTFTPQTDIQGEHGTFSIDENGAWTFIANSAFDELNMGDSVSESFTVTSVDGTEQDVTVTITGTNDAPVALDDTNSVDEIGGSEATGNVLSNDSDIDGDTIRVSQVEGNEIQGSGTITVSGMAGALDIDSTGAYTYTSTLSTPVMYGFNNADTRLGDNLDSFTLNIEAQQRVSSTADGVGVKGGANDRPVPDQINDTGDVLIADLGTAVSKVTFGVARLFDDERGGESGKWHAYDEDGKLVGSGLIDFNFVDYEKGSNHKGIVTIDADNVSGKEFQYIAFEGLGYQFDEGNTTSDGGDFFVTGITVQDVFEYTIVDDQGGKDDATLTVGSSASLIGYQPDLSAEPSSATVSEEGLAGGIPDSEGESDTTDAIIFNGTIDITKSASSNSSVTLSEPTTDLKSNGDDVTWSVADEGQTLVGTAGDQDVIKVTIDDQGEYQVELLGPVDHSDPDSENVLELEIDVNVSDGVNQTSTSLTVNIEDDSPVASPVSDTVAVSGSPHTGSLVTGLAGQGAHFGGDGAGYVKSISFDGKTYTYSPETNQIVQTGDGTTVACASGSGMLTVTTTLGSTLVLNMQDGSYTYTPDSNQTGTDSIGYTIVDADGDTSSSTFTFEAREPVQLQAESPELTSDLGLHGEYYGYNDDRVGSEDGKDYHGKIRLHADDGSANQDGDPNLNTIGEVASIIEGRVGSGIVGTGKHADANDTDASFVATNIDYDIDKTSKDWDLGNNKKHKSEPNNGNLNGNLHDFLAHGGDETSLEVASGLGQTTDAIIRLTGYVYLEQGTYDIRVTNDDGFRLTIGGKEVASFDAITPPIMEETPGVELDGGFQEIELLYWDQAERSVLKVELKKSGDDDSEYRVLSTDNFALFGEDPRPDLLDNQTLVRDEDGSFSILTGADYQGDSDANVVIGSQANDTIDGGAGNDILRGAGGNDILTGGLGADTFAWELGDQGSGAVPAQDTVMDFNASEGDKLDLSDLLQNKEDDKDIADYLRAADDGNGGTVLHISTSGKLGADGAGADQTINLEGVGVGDVDDLVAKGQIDI